MKHLKRLLAVLLAAALTAAASTSLAAPAGTAEFRIDASGMDVVERELSVALYRREDGRFQLDQTRQYPCKVNRATQDASFFIQADGEGVWVTVDYLTDINGDGAYELLVDDSAPVWDVMDAQERLAGQPAEGPPLLTGGQTYILSSDSLLARSAQAVQDRTQEAPHALDLEQSADAKQFPLCMIQIHCGDSGATQTYYLQLCGSVLMPTDISPSDWYYDAVEHALEQGYFSGADDGRFLPGQPITRAQLAQVLWTMGGCQQAPAAQFFDVSPSEWFYQAVSWCRQEGMIAGYTTYLFAPNDPLSWEQMLTILHRYAQYTGSNMRISADLSLFSDFDQVSPWAADSLRWAITHKLISSDGGVLRPGDSVTRAELASVLYAYELNLSLYR